MIAVSIGDAHTERPQFTGVMEIPKSCVKNITFLTIFSQRLVGQQQIDRPSRGHSVYRRFSTPLRRLRGLL